MWAQYSGNSTGVCIAINCQKFLDQNSKKLKYKFGIIDNIKYENILTAHIKTAPTLKTKNVNFLKENYEELFFKKHKDWEDEREVRLFGIGLPEYLSIENSIDSICLGINFLKNEDNKYRLLGTIVSSINNQRLLPRLLKNSFTSEEGYASDDFESFLHFELEKYKKYSQLLDKFNQQIK